MANNELAIRFTETTYATKSEVSKELKMSLIDNIWSNILSYRSFFNRYLTIKSIDQNALVLCSCPAIANLFNEADAILLKLTGKYMRLNIASGDLRNFEDKTFMMSVNEIAKANSLDIDDMSLKSLARGELKETSIENSLLVNYGNCLRFIKEKSSSPIDIDYLAELYSTLLNNNDLTSFYRTINDKNPENRVLIDRIYTSAPVNQIDSLMENLFKFIGSANLSASVKALITYYYVSYIKPFPKYSDEIAVLLSKSVLAHFELNELGVYLPFEKLLNENIQTIEKIFVEVQKTNDITYFVNYGMRFLVELAKQIEDIIAERDAFSIKQDFYQEDKPNENNFNNIETEPVVETNESINLIENDTINDAKEEPTVKPIIQQTVAEKPAVQERVPQELAYGYIPPSLDERSASRLEEHLLELDPLMKRGEAKFYARHCTMGMRYTIAQFKKSLGCAYETARTSMDHLVELGYYRKEMVKNKNVYTPVNKK